MLRCEIDDDINSILSEIDKIPDKNTVLIVYLEHTNNFLENCKNFKASIKHQKDWKKLYLVTNSRNIEVY